MDFCIHVKQLWMCLCMLVEGVKLLGVLQSKLYGDHIQQLEKKI